MDTKIIKLISLEGKTAMITGAASGIGKGAALRLAEAGADIILLDIDDKQGIQTKEQIQDLGKKAAYFHWMSA